MSALSRVYIGISRALGHFRQVNHATTWLAIISAGKVKAGKTVWKPAPICVAITHTRLVISCLDRHGIPKQCSMPDDGVHPCIVTSCMLRGGWSTVQQQQSCSLDVHRLLQIDRVGGSTNCFDTTDYDTTGVVVQRPQVVRMPLRSIDPKLL